MILLTGDYDKAKADYPDLEVVSQNLESGRDILNLGYKDAESGTKVVFTQVEHYLNGVRLAVKEKSVPAPEIYFFSGDFCIPIRVDSKGKLNQWPIGFFDAWDFALDRILS